MVPTGLPVRKNPDPRHGRGDDQGIGPYHSPGLRHRPDFAVHMSLSLTDRVGDQLDLAY
jgi:hypothetical protein